MALELDYGSSPETEIRILGMYGACGIMVAKVRDHVAKVVRNSATLIGHSFKSRIGAINNSISISRNGLQVFGWGVGQRVFEVVGAKLFHCRHTEHVCANEFLISRDP